ncbi:L-histidine N(alpha)-methyltransferase [Marivita sp.]|uniref:L-histidine N(alpha)-methyltransferase n=1 Tax=Marivita sp. TaxID=2003365 RepID=UPI0025C1A5C6|nr:L-histidine N(alpha)-methyltransferase [Marivita sp.]
MDARTMEPRKPEIGNSALYSDVIAGMSRSPKGLSPKWFYDDRGSAIFEEITQLSEYYPSRTERAILETGLARIEAHVPAGAALVELGSGASVKTRLLLNGLKGLSTYVPVDISEDFLHASAAELATDFPRLDVRPVVADFMQPVPLPDLGGQPVVGFFPGSTIGNLSPDAARALLMRLGEWPDHDTLILGVDLVKAPETLVAAYDDASGVTARFNLNLLRRLNREAGAEFDLETFRHKAIWNATEARVEMHLQSLEDQSVQIGDHVVEFAAGETIHTENSHKYSVESLSELARTAGWHLAEVLTDPQALFAVAILHRT